MLHAPNASIVAAEPRNASPVGTPAAAVSAVESGRPATFTGVSRAVAVSGRGTGWVVAAIVVALCWLLGGLVDTSGVAYGQTVPTASAVSTSAGSTAKRRPQLAGDGSGIFMVWEESNGTTNGTDLYYAWRDSATGTWTAPTQIVAYDPARWSSSSVVNEWYAHITLDGNGHLHMAYAQRAGSTTGAYYMVGKHTGGGALSWSAPRRLDYANYTTLTAGSLYNQDSTRLLVLGPSGGYSAVGYVLWTGNSGNKMNVTRVGYDSGANTTAWMDATPFANPATTVAGPVAVLDMGDGATLQLVYGTRNTSAGNLFFGAPFTLATNTWGTQRNLANNNAEDCSQGGCQGATAARDGSGNTWISAGFDTSAEHSLQTTSHDGASGSPATIADTPKTGRQPVIMHDAAGTGNMYVLYSLCTYVSAGTCTGKDTYYRSYSAGAWSAAVPVGPTTGEQKDLAGIMLGGDLYAAWVGTNQGGVGTGDQVYFLVVPAP
jgi:hypothetical protein